MEPRFLTAKLYGFCKIHKEAKKEPLDTFVFLKSEGLDRNLVFNPLQREEKKEPYGLRFTAYITYLTCD